MSILRIALILFSLVAAALPAAEPDPLAARVDFLLKEMGKEYFRAWDKEKEKFDSVGEYAKNHFIICQIGSGALPALREKLKDTEPWTVVRAADCLAMIGKPEDKKAAAQALWKARAKLDRDAQYPLLILYLQLRQDGPAYMELAADPELIRPLCFNIKFLPPEQSGPFLQKIIPFLEAKRRFEELGFIHAYLRDNGTKENIPYAKGWQARNTESPNSLSWATFLICRCGSKEDAGPLVENLVKSPYPYFVAVGLEAAARLKMPNAAPKQLNCFGDDFDNSRSYSSGLAVKLAKAGGDNAINALLKMTLHPNHQIREQFILALAQSEDKRCWDRLLELIESDVTIDRRTAYQVLPEVAKHYPKATALQEELFSRHALSMEEMEPLMTAAALAKRWDKFEYLMGLGGTGERAMGYVISYIRTVSRNMDIIGQPKVGPCLTRYFQKLPDYPQKPALLNYMIADFTLAPVESRQPLLDLIGNRYEYKQSYTADYAFAAGLARPPYLKESDNKMETDMKTSPDPEEYLIKKMSDENMYTRMWAAEKLGTVGGAKSLPVLQQATSDPSFIAGSGVPSVMGWFYDRGKIADCHFSVQEIAKRSLAKRKSK